jgi:hypothetical protein
MGNGVKLSITHNLNQAMQDMKISEQEIPFRLARALTRTGQAVKAAEQEEMGRVFDRPTPYTMGSLQLTPATKADLRAMVWFKFGASKYMRPQVFGGERPAKRIEHWLRNAGILPGDKYVTPARGAPLDAYGNLPGGMYNKILTDMAAGPDVTQHKTERSRLRTRDTSKCYVRYKNGKPIGIWLRKGKQDIPLIAFISAPKYKPVFRFFEIAQEVASREIIRML